MSDRVPCYVCDVPTKNWDVEFPGEGWISFCPGHSDMVCVHLWGYGTCFAVGIENAFNDLSCPGWREYADKLRAELLANPHGAPIQPTAFPEAPCKKCQRKNDVGNPKVKLCWNCETPL